MMERKYSVDEIDRIREAVKWQLYRGMPMRVDEFAITVEERVRTYMLNGTDPEELEEPAVTSQQT